MGRSLGANMVAPFALVLALAAATAHGGASVSHVAAAALRRRLQIPADMPVDLAKIIGSKCDLLGIVNEPVKPQ